MNDFARHVYTLHTFDGGAVRGRCWTNDNLDQGYPSEEASWEVSYRDREHALKSTGGTHQGCNGCSVEVFIDGKLLEQ